MKSKILLSTPWLIFLILFYTLAIHMYHEVGFWPPIGNEGFSSKLNLHASISIYLFSGLFLFLIFGLPVWWLVSLIFHKKSFINANIFIGITLFSLFIMHLAPSGFINWWWD